MERKVSKQPRLKCKRVQQNQFSTSVQKKTKKWGKKIVKRETQKSPNLKSSSRDLSQHNNGARILYIQFKIC